MVWVDESGWNRGGADRTHRTYGCRWSAVIPFVAVMLAACGTARGLTISGAEFQANPSGRTPLAGLLTFTTDTPATATIFIEGPAGATQHTFSDAAGTQHRLMALGMTPNGLHRVWAEVADAGGAKAATDTFEMQTPPLPDDFPPFTVTVSRPRRMEPGLNLVPFFRWPAGTDPQRDFGLLVALDAQGGVVWYYRTDHVVNDPVALVNGNIAYQTDRNGQMSEIDMLGNVVRHWHSTGVPKDNPEGSIPVATDTFHHNFDQKPDGNFLLLSTEVREFESYPSSETTVPSGTAPATVIGDVILEIEPDGNIVREFKLFDLIDPTRIGYDSLGTGFYSQVYKDVLKTPGKDWSHTNSVFYDAQTDSAILSVRHLDIVFKLDLKTGKIAWILGNHDDWNEQDGKLLLKPVGEPFRWQYHQHAAKVTPQRTILLYDNGNYRARPGQERMKPLDSFSRVVEYKVDEAAMTVEQVWTYGDDDGAERFHSPFICDVDWMPETGNVFVTDGGRIKDKDGNPSVNIFAGRHWARIFEVTHETPATKVFEIVIDDPTIGWAVFRADRVPSLYKLRF